MVQTKWSQQISFHLVEQAACSRETALQFDILFGEFDPGSGRTLAACLTHASRTEMFFKLAF
jgi:hypothetical protein